MTLHPIIQTFSAPIPLFFDNAPQLAIRFLKNGVGITAPPVWALCSDVPSCITPHFYSADLGNLVLKTNPFLLITLYQLAISFLSNGVGETSPPMAVLRLFFPTSSLPLILFPNFLAFWIYATSKGLSIAFCNAHLLIQRLIKNIEEDHENSI